MFISEIKKIVLHAFVFYQYTYHIKTAFLIPVIFTCSIPLHVQFIVATGIVNDVKVSFKCVNIHNNCIVLRDDVPLGCD